MTKQGHIYQVKFEGVANTGPLAGVFIVGSSDEAKAISTAMAAFPENTVTGVQDMYGDVTLVLEDS